MATVHAETGDGIAILLIDNPPLNLLSNAIRAELLRALAAVEADDRIRAVVLAGAGARAFSAGSDAKEFVRDMDEDRGAERARKELEFLRRVSFFRKPTVAAIHGYALGGGCELAMACDLRVASVEAQIGFPEIKLGVFPINSIEGSLRLFGEAKTKELMFLGEPIDASAALRIGFLNRVVERGQALAEAQAIARRLAQLPAVSLTELKTLINHQYRRLLEEGGRLAAEAMAKIFRTEDVREGVAALLEKRPPQFRHR